MHGRENQDDRQARTSELSRQLAVLRNSQQDRLLNLRLLDEIDESTFASKSTELRDQIADLSQQIASADRNHAEQGELAVKTFELSQRLQEKWLTADMATKRQLLQIVCLNF